MKPNGSNARKLTRASEAAWSPDGRRLAIQRDGRIYTVHADGTHLRRLTTHFDDRTPVWSPDGTMIAFVSYPRIEGRRELYVMNADGTGERRLTRLDAKMPSWSPTGEIAFTTFDGLFTVGSDGQGLRKLFSGSVGSYAGVNPIAWSPDGTRIAFDTDRGLAVVDRQGHRRFLISPGNPSGETKPTDVEGYPTWSPDGRRILFESCRGIETIDADGTDRTLVTSTTGGCGFQSYPMWSPDGQRIAFNEDQVYVMGANGSGLKKLTPIPDKTRASH
jgi:Tol biopolymer transport system component